MRTITQIAKESGLLQHRLRYAIYRQNISPDEKIGNVGRFGPEKVGLILSYLAEDHRHKVRESSGTSIT